MEQPREAHLTKVRDLRDEITVTYFAASYVLKLNLSHTVKSIFMKTKNTRWSWNGWKKVVRQHLSQVLSLIDSWQKNI